MSEQKLPQAIASNSLTICGVELIVHVLDTGQRVIDMDSFNRFMDVLEGREVSHTDGELCALAKFVGSK
jgi:hypothetical protein